MSHVFRSITDWCTFRRSGAIAGETLGFVPTMGALHAGHASLVRQSRAENDHTLVSVFVNPTQFNDPRDLERYPRTEEDDLRLLSRLGADYVLLPEAAELYRDGYRFRLHEQEFSHELCGAHRPGHFDGVLTVVMKLLNLARADRAYFGEKDFQQLTLVRQMARAFFLETAIIGCPTVREADGLAMSSRNRLLTSEHRRQAPAFVRALRSEGSAETARAELAKLGFEVDYVQDRDGRRFGAVKLGQVRLIDNVAL